MGRLIVADTLSEHKFQEVEFHGGSLNAAYRQGWNDAIDAIVENEPTVDAVPVRRGKWIDKTDSEWDGEWDYWKCSCCGAELLSMAIDLNGTYLYCPKCGARMDGKGSGNETD